jgi:cytochrome b involved in lipid metabolism
MNLLLAGLAIFLVTLSGCIDQPNTGDNSVVSGDEVNKIMNDEFMQEQMNEMMNPVFSLEEVAKHNTKEDCWLAIEGNVYNVTEFIPAHPGGEALLQGCGTDATELFNTRPMGSGTPHSDKARDFLPDFFIGELG